MLETAAELERLQALLDESARRASPFLRQTFEIPARTPTAAAIVEYLKPPVDLALATVTDRGEPRVAPVTALFVHGRFWVPTERDSVRTRYVSANPAVSATHWVSGVSAFIAHGSALVLGPGEGVFGEVDNLHRAVWWEPLRNERRGVYIGIDARRFYAWAGPGWPLA